MNQQKIGSLIRALRMEKKLTQKQLAQQLNISDRTVSKWERGLGCPDVSLLADVAGLLQVPIEKMLEGELFPNQKDGGNMKRVEFYYCPSCGNVITSSASAQIGCCGRALQPLKPVKADQQHQVKIEQMDGELYLTFAHPMTKQHFVAFVAAISYDRVHLVRLYPEQGGELRMPILPRAKIYLYCTQHGLQQIQ